MTTAKPLLKYPSADDCPDVATHTPSPKGYLQWHSWAEEMRKTHTQKRCPTCGYWSICVPKKPKNPPTKGEQQ